MANIQTYLNKIKNAIYGRDVRDSIHDAIDAINTESENTKDIIEDFVGGELDTTLTSTTLPAQGKAVGNAVTDLENQTNAIYSGERVKDFLEKDIDEYIELSENETIGFDIFHGSISYSSGVTSFYLGACDEQKTVIKEIVRQFGNQAEFNSSYTVPKDSKYLRIVAHSTQNVQVKLVKHMRLNLETLENISFAECLNRHNFESGSWASNAKTSDTLRLRYVDRLQVSAGDIIKFVDNSSLYYSISVYADDSSTTSIESSGWIQEPYIIENNGVACINISNASTYGESSQIRVSDLTTDLIVISHDFQEYVNHNKNLSTVGVVDPYKIPTVNNSIDVQIPVPSNKSHMFVNKGPITYNASSTSFAIQYVKGTGNTDVFREYGSQLSGNYLFALPADITAIRIVLHTTVKTNPLKIAFISDDSVLSSMLRDSDLVKKYFSEQDALMLSIRQSKTYIISQNGIPIPFKYASKSLSGGYTLQDLEYTDEGTYILSSEADGILFVDTNDNITFKAVSDFGHGIAIQKLSDGNFMVASADANYGSSNVKRNIYHYNFETNTVLDSFTPIISGIMTYAWENDDGSYLILAQDPDNMNNVTAYGYERTNDTASIVGSFTIPATYIQGGYVFGNYLYLSINDGWNNTGDSYIIVYKLTDFSQINIITLSGIFKEVEGVCLFINNGDLYLRFGETHVARLFDAKLV